MRTLFNSLFFISILLLQSSCSKEVPIEFIGDYEFVGEFTATINDVPTSDNPYWIQNSFRQLMNTCSNLPVGYTTFSQTCIGFEDADKEKLAKLLEEYDIIVSQVPIKQILKNTQFTKQDGCDYYGQIVEVIPDKSKVEEKRIYLYKIAPKNEYRFVLCP